MPHVDAAPFSDGLAFYGEGPLLDIEALDAPRRMSRDEGRRAAGPDWFWTHLTLDEEFDND
ncbi:hypothetical protein [Brevundimonas sp.]|uniref:hypothetical protein n=1 Tax=Brevundimonas sp. TaxID=1871086 RepID=UPI00286B1930|nr:hypothetical protein [Brevundimonas sp.]